MPDTIIHVKATVGSSGHGVRVRKWIMTHYRHIVNSKENTRQSFKRGEISVNGVPCEETRILQENDIVQLDYNKTKEQIQRIAHIPIDIAYQDAHMAIIWKPPGINYSIFDKAIRYHFKNPCDLIWTPYCLQKAASGLLLIAKTQSGKERMIERYNQGAIQLGMQVLCHGQVPPNLSTVALETDIHGTDNNNDEEEEDVVDNAVNDLSIASGTQLFKSFDVVSVTRSNNSDYLSSVRLQLQTPWSSAAVRRFFFHRGYTIIGNSAATRPLKTHKDKGLYMTLYSIKMDKLFEDGTIQVMRDIPDKFKFIVEREQRFWERACERRIKEMRQAGLDISMDSVESFGKEPLAYTLGEKTFHGLRFEINKACLIPRPSSETLVDAAIDWLREETTRKRRILDMGTGCGNLIVSILAKVEDVEGVGVDISDDALMMARKNSDQLLQDSGRVRFLCKDMAQVTFNDTFGLVDLIVCNPPYLDPTVTMTSSQQQMALSYEPSEALYAKHQGFEWYMILSQLAPNLLAMDGRVILECGKGMKDRILLIWTGWHLVKTIKDKQGWDRCLVLVRNSS
ncbi:S-adenosyl-L-methionine-dependent methyltransferase [Halteromyces radiatus]|uniref:S-adenosyl-L-methionine-dependent methyltransferase n=1 Tax=Halteromyces radiatus TaxID=101107 RepID=UPI00221F9EE4|nr:S-adenosyl-L-methionine-dependent methyltransferase [Halteromyces radiatus]KAI8079872.1 S-adenosyl-L-methionine-dependent methyltransferase [Halteromyces radiatus]